MIWSRIVDDHPGGVLVSEVTATKISEVVVNLILAQEWEDQKLRVVMGILGLPFLALLICVSMEFITEFGGFKPYAHGD